MEKNKKHDEGLSRRGFLKTGMAGTLGGLALMNFPGILRGDTYPGPVNIPEMDPRSIRICYNENPLGPSPLAVTAMQNQATAAHLYPSWSSSSIRSALAAQYEMPNDRFIFGAGASEILHLVADAYLGPGDNLVWADPSYGQMAAEAQARGASVIEVPLTTDYRHDLSAMASAINGNTKVVIVTNPNNPTGTLIDPTDFDTFMSLVPNDVLVLVDWAYWEYLSDPTYPEFVSYINSGRKLLIVKTFSKVYGLAGARGGYGMSIESVIDRLAEFKILASMGCVTEAGCAAALGDTQHITDTVTLNNQAKAFLYSEFTRMGLDYIPSETNFVMVDCGRNSESVYNELSSRGIYVRRGWGMYDWLRVSTGSMADMAAFTAALEDILFGPPPPPVQDLTIKKAGSDANLRWSAPGEVDWYEIYRSQNANFVPTQADSVGSTMDTTWTDPGVITNSDYYYYRVKSKRNSR